MEQRDGPAALGGPGASSGAPVVSAVVCTRDRPRLLARALRSVLSQEWLRDPDRAAGFELVVADDGDGPPPDLASVLPGGLPAGLTFPDRVRLLRTRHRGPGAARCEGFDAARGLYIAPCDDDDEWAPGHLGALLGYVLDHPEVDLAYGDLTPPARGEGAAGAVHPSAAVFKAGVAHELGGFYPHLQAHEDEDLWLRLTDHGRVVRRLPIVAGRRGLPEDRVSAAPHPRDLGWVLEAHERRTARGEGRPEKEREAGRRAKGVAFDPSTWRGGRRELLWSSVLRAEEGYGSAGRSLLLALEEQGVDVAVAAGGAVPRGLERFHGRFSEEPCERLGFYYDHRVRPGAMPCERLVSYSMWESTLVPRRHVEEINGASSLHYVPCRQNAESHKACGVSVPVKVLRHGVDGDRFPYLERDRGGVYTFGTFGDLSPRKGTDVLLRAFLDEFGPGEPVRLLLKSTAPRGSYGELAGPVDDPRVELVGGFLGEEALLGLLRRMDAFVLPSRGEGFGLCGPEAMSTGLPLIATDWSGPSEYLDPADSYPLSYDLVDAGGVRSNNVRYSGLWAEPDHEHLRHLLRHLYENPEEGASKGRAAAWRVRRELTWEKAAAQVVDDLDALVAGALPAGIPPAERPAGTGRQARAFRLLASRGKDAPETGLPLEVL